MNLPRFHVLQRGTAWAVVDRHRPMEPVSVFHSMREAYAEARRLMLVQEEWRNQCLSQR